MTQSFQLHYGPGLDSASNRNEYQEYFLGGKCGRCVGLTTLPPSCAECLEIWEPQTPGTLRACSGLYRNCFNFYSFNQFNLLTGRFSNAPPVAKQTFECNTEILLNYVLDKGRKSRKKAQTIIQSITNIVTKLKPHFTRNITDRRTV